VVYLASSASLTALELLVHTNPEDAPDDLVILEVDIPDDAIIDRYVVSALPTDWRAVSAPPACQALGDAWVEGGITLGLSLPSVVMPTEHNILLNPAHPDMRRTRVLSVTPFQFDPRLLG
jgi:RES domain-containing protein